MQTSGMFGAAEVPDEQSLLVRYEAKATPPRIQSDGVGRAEAGGRYLPMLEYMDKREDCVTVLRGHKISLYTRRPSGQRTEDCPPPRAGARGLSHVRMPPHLRTPPHLSCPDASSSLCASSSLMSGRLLISGRHLILTPSFRYSLLSVAELASHTMFGNGKCSIQDSYVTVMTG